ncbi:unannotated protein [freshwater metagenome]|uniref:Unannotated protein n=1 Tax=freshwater metagenome TaxID=449393 RepID=A0A6J6TL65_9ZZZZ
MMREITECAKRMNPKPATINIVEPIIRIAELWPESEALPITTAANRGKKAKLAAIKPIKPGLTPNSIAR